MNSILQSTVILNAVKDRLHITLRLCMLIFLSQTVYAGTVHLQLDHDNGELGEPFQLSVSISGDLSGKLELPDIPNLVITGTGSSTNISWINGHLSKEVAYNYVIEPQKEGVYTIPSMKLKVDGDWVTTEAIKFSVHSGGANPPAQAQNPRNSRNSAQNQQMQNDSDDTQDAKDPNVFIEREFSKTDPYEGEPVVVTTKIYHRVQFTGAEPTGDKPVGVRIIDIKQSNGQEQRGNSIYNVIVIQQTFLPLRSGTLNLPGFRIKASMIMPSAQKQQRRRGGSPFDDFFDDFFNGARNRVVQRVFTSKDAVLNVKAIPSENRPAGYKDLVGTFRITNDLSQTELKAGDTATLTITIDGVGALDTMGNLDLHLDPNIRVYPDKAQVQEKATENHGLESKRVYRYALVPLHKGDIKLGEIKIPYFDLSANKFEELKTDLGSLKVAEGDVKDSLSVTTPTGTTTSVRSDVKSLASDLVDIHRTVSLDKSEALTEKDYLLIFALMGIPGLLCVLIFLFQFMKSQSQSRQSSRRKIALKNFEKRMQDLERDPNASEFLEQCYAAYRTYIGDKFDMHGAALTAKEIREGLAKHKIPKELLSQVEDLANAMEQNQYARESSSKIQANALLSNMKNLVREIEKQC